MNTYLFPSYMILYSIFKSKLIQTSSSLNQTLLSLLGLHSRLCTPVSGCREKPRIRNSQKGSLANTENVLSRLITHLYFRYEFGTNRSTERSSALWTVEMAQKGAYWKIPKQFSPAYYTHSGFVHRGVTRPPGNDRWNLRMVPSSFFLQKQMVNFIANFYLRVIYTRLVPISPFPYPCLDIPASISCHGYRNRFT